MVLSTPIRFIIHTASASLFGEDAYLGRLGHVRGGGDEIHLVNYYNTSFIKNMNVQCSVHTKGKGASCFIAVLEYVTFIHRVF